MWVVPDEPGVTPGYQQLEIDDELLRGGLVTIASGITALAVQQGGLAEGLALASVVGLTLVLRSDVAAALLGVVAVAALRWAGL